MKKYIPILASELRRPYGTGRVLVRMSFSKPVVRDMDDADLGDANRSGFVEFGTRLLLALCNVNLDEREVREIKFLLSKMVGNGGKSVFYENVEKIFDVQRRP